MGSYLLVMIFGGLGLLALLWGLLWLLGRAVRHKGRPPRQWISPLVLSWAGLWVIEREVNRSLLAAPDPPAVSHRVLIGFTVLLCLLGYAVAWALILRLPPLTNWEKELDELGKDNKAGDS